MSSCSSNVCIEDINNLAQITCIPVMIKGMGPGTHLPEEWQIVEILQEGVQVAGGTLIFDAHKVCLLPAVISIALILLNRNVNLWTGNQT